MKYYDLVIDNKSKATDTMYTYCSEEDLEPGQKVYVSFARNKGLKEAYVFRVRDSYDGEYELKEIAAVDPDICLNDEMIRTCEWMRRRYLVKYIDGVNCFTPPGSAPKREPKAMKEVAASEEPKALTEEQEAAYTEIENSLIREKEDIFLIHGVTSSGKTEVYMQAIAKAVSLGKTAIMMVPEVALTNEMISRFEKRFGSDMIAVMHYKLTKPQRYRQWQRIRSGGAKIVIGARSAVFAPLEDIGVVILDEEHESSYKSDMTPRYDTVDVAVKRAREYGGIVILGSATPSVVSTYRAETGIYRKLSLTKRYNLNPLPDVEIVDMNDEIRQGNFSLFSNSLYKRILENLELGRQVILFINRRGFSTYIRCADCGTVVKCHDCGIPLTYHKDRNAFKCHYCGRVFPNTQVCGECGGKLVRRGAGTEKAVEDIEKLFEGRNVGRLDFDTASRAGGSAKVLDDFRRKRTDILIGTQLVAKGLDFDNVGVVGVLNADNDLNIPDYRSPERTFQLITQVSGRAGRGDFTGHVVIQTFTPDNYVIRYAADNDYTGFYNEEIGMRKIMDYPPYTDLIKLLFTGDDEETVKAESARMYDHLKSRLGGMHMYYPQPAPMMKIKDTYRYQSLIKCPKGQRTRCLKAIDEFDMKSKVNVGVDINPYSFT